jgi:hypothetical protein
MAKLFAQKLGAGASLRNFFERFARFAAKTIAGNTCRPTPWDGASIDRCGLVGAAFLVSTPRDGKTAPSEASIAARRSMKTSF